MRGRLSTRFAAARETPERSGRSEARESSQASLDARGAKESLQGWFSQTEVSSVRSAREIAGTVLQNLKFKVEESSGPRGASSQRSRV